MQRLTHRHRYDQIFFKCLVILFLQFSGFWPVYASVGGPSPQLKPQRPPKLILAFGDSLTKGQGLPAAQSVPARLEAALNASGTKVTIHNAGVSGDSTTAGRARLNWVLASLQRKPDLVILELGANDALRGKDPKIARDNLDAMMSELSKRNIPVLIAGMKAPPNMGKDYAVAFNRIFPDLAKRYKAPLYPFYLEGVAGNPKLNQADGMHPTEAGVIIIVQKIMPMVQRALGK